MLLLQCKPSCGSGWKTREVRCMSSDRRERFDDAVCDAMQKPITRTQCNNGKCPPPRWHVGKWSACSAPCGQGQRTRRVVCISKATGRQSDECPMNRKPRTMQQCESSCDSGPPADQCVDDKKVAYCPLVLKFKFCNRTYFRKMCCATCSRMG